MRDRVAHLRLSALRLSALLGLALLLCTTLVPAKRARADSLFSAESLERSMLDLYCQFPDQNPAACPNAPKPRPPGSGNPSDDPQAAPGLSSADTAVWALEIFDQVSMLETQQYNDVLAHMSADYRQHPEHRTAIELVLSSIAVQHSEDVTGSPDHTADAMRERLRTELRNIRERNPVLTVVDDALIAFSIAYTFEFGKGLWNGGRSLWASRGLGLSKLDRFAIAVGFVTKEVKGIKKLELAAIGIGTVAGIAHAVYQSFETVKIDPHHLLEPVQGDIVHTLATNAAARRDEFRAMLKETNDQLRQHALAYRDRMNVVDQEVTDIQKQMEHLYNVAAQLRPQMEPVAQDLTEVRQKLTQLGMKLDGLELTGGTGLK